MVIVIILSVPIVIFVVTFLLFFYQPSGAKRPSAPMRSPHKRGTNITTFGLHPRRVSAVHARHTSDEDGVDEHERVYQANIKARETVPQYTNISDWERHLYFLNLADPPLRYLAGSLLIVGSAAMSMLICLLFVTGYSELIHLAIFMVCWLCLWGIFLDILRSTA